MPHKHILITGGTGFLGQYLTRDLLAAFPEADIRIIDLIANPYPLQNWSTEPRVEIRTGFDICRTDDWAEALDGIDTVIHLAGLIRSSPRDRPAMEKVNVEGTRVVINAVEARGIPHLVTIGSVASLGYGDDKGHPINEEFQFDWRIARRKKKYYPLTKHAAVELAWNYRHRGHPVLVVHPGLMFGPGDHTNTVKMIRAVRAGKMAFAPPGGTNVVDVRDVSRGLTALLQAGITDGDYLLSGWNLTINEVFSTIARTTNSAAPKMVIPRYLLPLLYWGVRVVEMVNPGRMDLSASDLDSSFRFRYFDHGKATAAIDWRPEITFAETIQDAVNWMRDHEVD